MTKLINCNITKCLRIEPVSPVFVNVITRGNYSVGCCTDELKQKVRKEMKVTNTETYNYLLKYN